MLGALFAVMLLFSAGYQAYSQRNMVKNMVENEAAALAQSQFDSVDTPMLTRGYAKPRHPA